MVITTRIVIPTNRDSVTIFVPGLAEGISFCLAVTRSIIAAADLVISITVVSIIAVVAQTVSRTPDVLASSIEAIMFAQQAVKGTLSEMPISGIVVLSAASIRQQVTQPRTWIVSVILRPTAFVAIV